MGGIKEGTKNLVEPVVPSISLRTTVLIGQNCEVAEAHLGVTPPVPGGAYRDVRPWGGYCIKYIVGLCTWVHIENE